MSKRLGGRVRRLERRAGPAGLCPECEDRPPIRVQLTGAPRPGGCSRCGREPLVIRIMPRPVVVDTP